MIAALRGRQSLRHRYNADLIGYPVLACNLLDPGKQC
jgi:hypothetical protein